MENKIDAKEIMNKLTKLQVAVDYIKEHIEDTTLTEDDISSIKDAKQDYKNGKTRRL